MSWLPGNEPTLDPEACPEQVEMVIIPRSADIGGFDVKRALPFRKKRLVGPFIFWDQMGPGEFVSGKGVDVRPHPHIGLSTVTYLFDGSMMHRDSLGSSLEVLPGDINLMSAGGGIAHSERTSEQARAKPSRLFGIQSWIAQPKSHEFGKPDFGHYAAEGMPTFEDAGVTGRVLMGSHEGLTSPVRCDWDTLYLDVTMEAGASVSISKNTEERALYVIHGDIEIGGTAYDPQRMLVLCPGRDSTIKATSNVRMLVLGGAVMDGPRHIWWNFVSSDREAIEHAKDRWRNREFPEVPNDDEYTPLPD